MSQEEHPSLPEVYYVLQVEDPECEDGFQEWSFGMDPSWVDEDVVLYCAGVLFVEGYNCLDSWKVIRVHENTEDMELIFMSEMGWDDDGFMNGNEGNNSIN